MSEKPTYEELEQRIIELEIANDALKESETFLNLSQKISGIGSYITNLKTGIWRISKEMYSILGIDKPYPHTLEGFLAFVHPDSLEDFLAYHHKVETERLPFDYEYKIIRVNDKAVRWVHGLGSIEYDEHSHPVRRVGTIQDITDRKLADRALQESELKYQQMTNQIPGMLYQFVMHKNGSYSVPYVSEKIFDYSGITQEQVYADPSLLFRSIHPDDIDFIQNQILRSAEELSEFNVEHRLVTHSGELKWFKVNSIPTRLENGDTFWNGISIEITEQKSAEQTILAQAKNLEIIFNSVPNILVLVDENGRAEMINDKGAAFSERGKSDLIGLLGGAVLNCLHSFTSDGCGRSLECDDCPVRTRVVSTLETGKPHIEKDGKLTLLRAGKEEIVDLLITTMPLNLDGTQKVLLSLTDITERKQVENDLLREKQFTEKLLESLPGIFFLYDSTCHLKRWNKAHETTMGFSADELRDWYIPNWHEKPEDAKIGMDLVKSVLESGQSESFETTLINKEGNFIPYLINIARLVTPESSYIMGVGINITKRKQAEEDNKILQSHLIQAQKMEAVGHLAGGVAHDFNNMLGVILGYTEMALEQVDTEQPIFSALEEIQHAAERSSDLTRQLLAFARKQTISPKVLDLNSIVGSMMKMLQRLIGENIELKWFPGDNLGQIRMDPSQIDQVLANLCINARDSITDMGKVIIETTNVHLDQSIRNTHAYGVPGDFILLTVSDNGSGMEKETLAHLFEPFYTTKKTGEGTGLGLATVYGIVKQNKGLINVYSELGYGTTFKIYLPRYFSKTGKVSDSVVSHQILPGHETILLVEDEPMILGMTTLMLQRLGYNVLPASTPGEAISLANEQPGEISLLITDVVMPEMNGRELSTKLNSLRPNLKCLFMSGYTANVIAHHGVIDENVHFIQKPFSKKELAAILREILA